MSQRVTQDDVARYKEERDRAIPPRETFQPTEPLIPEKFVLYTSTRKDDVGSVTMLRLIESVREDFRVVDMESVNEDARPEWLDGTPVLVDLRDEPRLAHKGTAAIQLVRQTYSKLRK